ncbi:MAG: hypothetical protein F6K36_25535 [Symploca sp. SIO3C6]|uniref:Uncharacterized protein n=1 Tax=Symploca sp. SIO1C4 TaxID=2607765 RepID=A0A6B3NNR9_9CYAN|nr:hypothetical protein [Symploca sp. SIO3C6]NER31191.1 hypothetical protein [Symploca sp. SIO1C4]NET05134.1 hypothetical protein [Symploca sp. SIO2B6]
MFKNICQGLVVSSIIASTAFGIVISPNQAKAESNNYKIQSMTEINRKEHHCRRLTQMGRTPRYCPQPGRRGVRRR